MCFFFIQSCEPLGKKINDKKNAHHSFTSLVSYLPPFLPPLHTSPQLTETWQWPICMFWQPKLTLLFFWSRLLGSGKVLAPTPCHPWDTFGIGGCPVPPEPSPPLWGAGAIPPLPRHHAPPLPARAPRAGRVTLFLSNCKSHQLPNCVPLSKDTCRLATVAFCDSALFWRSRSIRVCDLSCITCTVSYLSARCFCQMRKCAPVSWGCPREAQCLCFCKRWWKVWHSVVGPYGGSKRGLACLKFIDIQIYSL